MENCISRAERLELTCYDELEDIVPCNRGHERESQALVMFVVRVRDI
jgi:hypothetical protein